MKFPLGLLRWNALERWVVAFPIYANHRGTGSLNHVLIGHGVIGMQTGIRLMRNIYKKPAATICFAVLSSFQILVNVNGNSCDRIYDSRHTLLPDLVGYLTRPRIIRDPSSLSLRFWVTYCQGIFTPPKSRAQWTYLQNPQE